MYLDLWYACIIGREKNAPMFKKKNEPGIFYFFIGENGIQSPITTIFHWEGLHESGKTRERTLYFCQRGRLRNPIDTLNNFVCETDVSALSSLNCGW